ncbi:MAG: hypothetical protein RIR65_1645 [Planctomycetota bacterium]
MHHHQDPHPAPHGNRPAKGARIVDSQSGLAAPGAREGAIDFLGLGGLELEPQPLEEEAQHGLAVLFDAPTEHAQGGGVPAAPSAVDSARAQVAPAGKLAVYAAPPTPAAGRGRKSAVHAALLVLAALGAGALWSTRDAWLPVVDPASATTADTAVARPARRVDPAAAAERQINLTESAPVVAQPVQATVEQPAAPAEPARMELAQAEPTRLEQAPGETPRAESARSEPVPSQPMPAPSAAPAPDTTSSARTTSAPATQPEPPLARAGAAASAPANVPPSPHAAIAARLKLERRLAARHARSPLALASFAPRPSWPAGSGSTLLEPPTAVEAPRLVRDFAPAEPSVPGGPRRVAPETSGHVHLGADIPVAAMRAPTRLLTPKVGEVRVLLRSGETFAGRLHALGEGGAWLDTDLGRMLLHESQVRGIEAVAHGSVPGVADGGGVERLPRVRVVCAGGVFTGALVSRQGDDVVLATDEGSRIKLKAVSVEAVSREGTQVRGRLPSKAKD